MKSVFLTLLNLSVSACYIVLAVLLLRLLFKKAPKWTRGLLWAVVALRLVCPFSIESVLSLIPAKSTVIPTVTVPSAPDYYFGVPVISETVRPTITPTYPSIITEAPKEGIDYMYVLSIVWAVGVAVMLVYMAYSYIKMKHLVREAVHDGEAWICDSVDTPFILGVFKPKIYMPSYVKDGDRAYIISHEKAHIRRFDFIWKPLGFVLLSVYWFNPLMWLAYILLCKDIELACDEKVIKELGTDSKAGYSTALINCSVTRKKISACPLAFGETAAKERVKGVLSYKKPTFWIIVVAILACAAVAVCLLTRSPAEENDGDEGGISGDISADISLDISEDNSEEAVITDGSKTIYVWQMGHGSYSFAMLPTKQYSAEELFSALSDGAGMRADEMRAEIEKQGIDKSKITVVPYQHPLSSYVGSMFVIGQDGKPNGVREEYMNTVKALLGLEAGAFRLDSAAYTCRSKSLDMDNIGKLSSKNKYLKYSTDISALPLVEVHSVEEMCAFFTIMNNGSTSDKNYLEAFKARYDDEYFKHSSLLLIHVVSGTGSARYYFDGVTINDGVLHINIMNCCPTLLTCDMAYWVMAKEIKNEMLSVCDTYTVTMSNQDCGGDTNEPYRENENFMNKLAVTVFDYEPPKVIKQPTYMPVYPDMGVPIVSEDVKGIFIVNTKEALDELFSACELDEVEQQKLSAFNAEFFKKYSLVFMTFTEYKDDKNINTYGAEICRVGNDLYFAVGDNYKSDLNNGGGYHLAEDRTNAAIFTFEKSELENIRIRAYK